MYNTYCHVFHLYLHWWMF